MRSSLAEAPSIEAFGVRLCDWEEDEGSRDAVFRTLVQALTVIDRCYPLGVRRVTKNVNQVAATVLVNRLGEYAGEVDTIFVKRDVLLDAHGWWHAALIILHEATHAELRRKGCRRTPEMRARMEGVCRRRELVMARRMEGADATVAWLEGLPESPVRDPLEMQLLHVENTLARLEAAGLPAPAVRLLARYYRWRLRRWAAS